MCPNWGRHKRAILETVSHLALGGASFLGYGSGRTRLNKRIKIHVQRGWVIVKGTVHSKFQRAKVEEVVRRVKGVKGLSNRIKIKAVAVERRPGNKTETATKHSSDPQTRPEDGAATPTAGLLDRAS
jgi:hypothetical protein